MPEEVLFETEQDMHREAIAEYLRTVAEKLDGNGTLALEAGDQNVKLDVPDRPTFEVKAERETGDGSPELSVEFELEWNENGNDGSGDGTLTIE